MTNDLISIIVPVYNVKEYLGECLNSLKDQSYENIEVIMVNDGSTDGSEEICERFCEDNRFRLINKENGGLSSARNAGIAVAGGKYISFVDSDDFVDRDFILKLYESMIENHSQISIIGYQTCSEKNSVIEKYHYYKQGIIPKEEIMNSILVEENIANYAWNKLYSTRLFRYHRFPEGKAYEDVFIMYQLLDEANCISICTDCLYNYRIRSNSITKTPSKKNLMDILEATQNRAEYISKKYTSLLETCNNSLLSCMVVIYHWYAKNGIYDADTKKLSQSIHEITGSKITRNRNYYEGLLISHFSYLYVKFMHALYHMFGSLRRKK